MGKGWIKIDRNFIDWEWFDCPNTVVVWMYLLLNANIKDYSYKGVMVPRGSLHTTEKEISEKCGLSRQEVRTALSHIKSTKGATIVKHGLFSVISIVSYDKYQGNQPKNQPMEQPTLYKSKKVYCSKPKEEGFAERTGKSRSSSSQKKKVELRDDSEFLG